jgi:class 3 adenylate cyclase
MSGSVPPRRRRAGDDSAPRLDGAQISAISRFPDDNPNPVLRIDAAGHMMYANPASSAVLEALGAAVGQRVAASVRARLDAAASARGFIEIEAGSRTFELWPVPIPDLGFTNVYGRDVTADRAIVKFPDENPNPVLRVSEDGRLLYANPASEPLVSGLGIAVGEHLAGDLHGALANHARAADGRTVELETGGRTFALLPVSVPSFGFTNVYGTDVTAVKERERLARENERLLLNILPEPIARRLREGEPLIADRFDDVTLMFADVVEFTKLSSTMSPRELVTILNDTFCVFDGLVEDHGLEKIKTIGDAYMVVGGMPERTEDHTSRVASMALDLADAVGQLEAANRFGIRFRIGLHCGPVVAGVIGTRRFIYDVWGDTVNLASRMESLGVPGRVQVTGAVVDRLQDTFRFEPRGVIDVKGKGPMPTWFLVDRLAV